MFGRHFMRRLGLLTAILLLSCQGGVAAELNISDYEGKVVVLDFWASWCVPCRRSFPWLNDMHAKYGDDGLVIIGVNLDQERSEAEAFLQEFPAQFQIHFDESKALATKYEVVAMPSSYLLGPDGEIFKRHYGFKVKKQEEYEAAIVAALEKLK